MRRIHPCNCNCNRVRPSPSPHITRLPPLSVTPSLSPLPPPAPHPPCHPLPPSPPPSHPVTPPLSPGKRVVVAAHGNSLRALVKYLDNISEKDILELNIPTGETTAITLITALTTSITTSLTLCLSHALCLSQALYLSHALCRPYVALSHYHISHPLFTRSINPSSQPLSTPLNPSHSCYYWLVDISTHPFPALINTPSHPLCHVSPTYNTPPPPHPLSHVSLFMIPRLPSPPPLS